MVASHSEQARLLICAEAACSFKAAVAIDVLEGMHTIAMRWETSSSVPTSNVVYTKEYSAEVTHYFSSGHTYWISCSAQGIHINQDTPSNIHEYTGIMPDTEFPEYFKEQIINSRNAASF